MNIQKNKTNIDTNIEKAKPNNVFLENIKALWQRTVTDPIFEHRLAVRSTLNSLNLITIISILPFFVGFFDFLNQNQSLKKILFHKNIPAFNVPTEILDWNTFRYFTETKKSFLQDLNKVEWSANSLFLTKTFNTELFDQEYFIASIDHPNFVNLSKQNISKNSSDVESIIAIDSKLDLNKFGSNRLYLTPLNKKPHGQLKTAKGFGDLLEIFYLNLDEIPLKIEQLILEETPYSLELNNNDQLNFDSKTLPFQHKIWKKTTNNVAVDEKKHNILSVEEKTNYRELFSQPLTKNNGFANYSIHKQLPAVNQVNQNNFFQKNTNRTSSFDIQRSNSYKEKQNALVLNRGNILSFFSQQKDIHSLEEIILHFEEFLLEQDFFSIRRMSGYSYPDMNSKKVSSFLIHNIYDKKYNLLPTANQKNIDVLNKNENTLKINLPATPNFLNNFYIFGQDLTSKKGRLWIQNYFSPENPLTDSKNSLLKAKDHTTDPVLKFPHGDTELTTYFSNASPIMGEYPYLTQHVWQKFYTQNKTRIKNLTLFTVTHSSIITEIKIPENESPMEVQRTDSPAVVSLPSKPPALNFELSSTVDYVYSPQNITKKIKTPFQFTQEIASCGDNLVRYKKVNSIFQNPYTWNKNLLFSENWEPLTFRSWLTVSKIGFAVLFFNLIKYIYTDYFKELLTFIIKYGFSKGFIDDSLKQEIDILTGESDKGFRVISKTKNKKKFQDIAGIKTLLPEIAEIVWFLRNSGKQFSGSKNFPKGLLLIGPPGTGKTVLVQALAGEAGVPVVALSGSSLLTPGESGALKLQNLFQEARQLAPCIVFIDEIDTLAQKRQGVLENPTGSEEILSVLEYVQGSLSLGGQSNTGDFLKSSQTSYFKNTYQIAGLQFPSEGGEDLPSPPTSKLALDIKQQMQAHVHERQQQLSLLLQLLIELDGVHGRTGVIIIGATNRYESLDAAILRPGRFDKILELGLPNHKKRVDIFKLYANILGYDSTISWEYFAKRTVGFTAADLASIMNQSCLKAILDYNEPNQRHSLETIEHGIDRITTSEIEKPTRKVTDLYLNRIAYYQCGKIVLSTILEYQSPTLVSYLWPRRQNRRSLQILTNLQKYFFNFARRCELEDRIVGAYGGKAAEILFLQNSHYPTSVSSFGIEDLSFAFVLICFVIEKWHFYSKSTLLSQLTQIISNKNMQEFIPDKIELFKELASSIEFSPQRSHQGDIATHPIAQNFFFITWWQRHISQELDFVERNFSDWFRLYLPNPQETELNIEWSPPDEFYHQNLLTKQINKNSSITWNELQNIVRDYQVHGFVLQSFNKAFCLLDENREYLDKLAFELIKTEVLREPEIQKIASSFLYSRKQTTPKSSNNISGIKIVNNSFGQLSRRKIKNWIDFKDFDN